MDNYKIKEGYNYSSFIYVKAFLITNTILYFL